MNSLERLEQEYADLRRELLSRARSDALSLNNRDLSNELARQTEMTNRLVMLGNAIEELGGKVGI